ncbi:MAG: STAS domain-containing protein [Planctomycetes bacterium]|nr:STAS domain-containing protein [Planctomycetota bacterium]
MELQTKLVQKSICAHIKGDVDSGNALALRDALDNLANQGTPVVFLDMAEVVRMDSAGIAILLEFHDRLKKAGRHLGLVNIPKAVKGMMDVFEVHADLETGLKDTKRIQADWQRLHEPKQQ